MILQESLQGAMHASRLIEHQKARLRQRTVDLRELGVPLAAFHHIFFRYHRYFTGVTLQLCSELAKGGGRRKFVASSCFLITSHRACYLMLRES